jgi:hypothetical protein
MLVAPEILPCRYCGRETAEYVVTKSWAGNLNFFSGEIVCQCGLHVQAEDPDGIADKATAIAKWNARSLEDQRAWEKKYHEPEAERQGFMSKRDREWNNSGHKCFACGKSVSAETFKEGLPGYSYDIYYDTPVSPAWLCSESCKEKWREAKTLYYSNRHNSDD